MAVVSSRPHSSTSVDLPALCMAASNLVSAGHRCSISTFPMTCPARMMLFLVRRTKPSCHNKSASCPERASLIVTAADSLTKVPVFNNVAPRILKKRIPVNGLLSKSLHSTWIRANHMDFYWKVTIRILVSEKLQEALNILRSVPARNGSLLIEIKPGIPILISASPLKLALNNDCNLKNNGLLSGLLHALKEPFFYSGYYIMALSSVFCIISFVLKTDMYFPLFKSGIE